MEEIPIVSIKSYVYNHEPFLRECLDGFVMQKTNFPFEVIVHDDASTDKSADIIREYIAKYPDIFKPIYETENQYSKHDGALTRIVDSKVRGKYVAYCEGDDYWIDPLKLQRQVDFLENNPEYVLCCTHCNNYDQSNKKIIEKAKYFNKDTDISNKTNITEYWACQTLTVMYRRNCFNLDIISKLPNFVDAHNYYLMLMHGKGRYLNYTTAVYRLHQTSMFSSLLDFKKEKWAYNVDMDLLRIDPNSKILKRDSKREITKFHILYYQNEIKNNNESYLSVIKKIIFHTSLQKKAELTIDFCVFIREYIVRNIRRKIRKTFNI